VEIHYTGLIHRTNENINNSAGIGRAYKGQVRFVTTILWALKAFAGVIVLNYFDSVRLEEPVAFVIVYSSRRGMERLSVHLKCPICHLHRRESRARDFVARQGLLV